MADGVAVLLLAVEDDLLRCVAARVLDEVAGLHEHAAGAAGRVEDDAVVRLDDVDDGLHDRRRREELAVVVGLLHRELGQEVLVDAAEDVAGGLRICSLSNSRIRSSSTFGLEDAVVLGEDALKRLELRLDRGHRVRDELGEVGCRSWLPAVMIQS